MTGEQLKDEGERLSRWCMTLEPEGEDRELAAVWGGPGLVPAPSDRFRHWLTVACKFFPKGLGPSRGCLSVYTDEEDSGGVAVLGGSVKLTAKRGHTRLYAYHGKSYPPIEAIFQLGSPAVQKWLKANKWKPEWAYNNNFKDKKPVIAYETFYHRHCPMYSLHKVHAVLGGWHFPWPDGDWAELLKRQLLVWTFQDSEPWVEVWRDKKGFEVKQRIT